MGDLVKLDSLLEAAREMAPEPTMTSSQPGDSKLPAKVSGVPPRRWEASLFGNFRVSEDNREAYDRCKSVAAGDDWCGLLAGKPGTGKTHLAIAAMHEYGPMRSYFWKVPDFLEWIREVAYGDHLGVFEVLKDYVTKPILLVLDDLGVEKQTEWVDEQLYRVLDARYELELPTIITSNQQPDRIDQRIRSRYAQGLVVCGGADQRRAR